MAKNKRQKISVRFPFTNLFLSLNQKEMITINLKFNQKKGNLIIINLKMPLIKIILADRGIKSIPSWEIAATAIILLS